MVVFNNKFAPEWISVKRNQHPLRNEYHSTTCLETTIIFWIECVEGEDKKTKVPYSEYKFEHEFG